MNSKGAPLGTHSLVEKEGHYATEVRGSNPGRDTFVKTTKNRWLLNPRPPVSEPKTQATAPQGRYTSIMVNAIPKHCCMGFPPPYCFADPPKPRYDSGSPTPAQRIPTTNSEYH